ncbi:MAG: energy-coupling factor transporter ATPase [Candidatus Subteraquimicrobiales bacterium]|nr:energy-coupling factor transporter ATPase [Candidatus Subteraquimicrobiales bacterium]
MIELINLSFAYNPEREDKVTALKNINLKVDGGEFVVILGHNGSGKSTLAYHLNGLLLPTSGDVIIEGMNTKNPDYFWKVKEEVGIVFQNPGNQIVATIVEEDVAFGLENLGFEKDEIRKRVNEALEIVGMSSYVRYEPHLLSQGQKQKVAIAGILAMRPKYMVLDEPTSQLDPGSRKNILEVLHRLNKEYGVTIIHITHFVEEALNAGRVLVMKEGEVILDGSPVEIFKDLASLISLGIIPPPVMILAEELAKSGLKITLPVLSIEEMVDALCS